MNIAIIGTGISGNVVAHRLHKEHNITVFEANDYIGGHTHTHDVTVKGEQYQIDTGFIVFNHWTYPNFSRLLDELDVASQPSDMSFSVRCERSGLEYNGTNLNSLFAQRRNLARPSFLRMLADILRFNKSAQRLLETPTLDISLGQLLEKGRYSPQFVDHYIIPMGSAIWSTDPALMFGFPAIFFLRFLQNHGMLSIDDRPQWRVIKGGSKRYVEKLIAPFQSRIKLNTPVEYVKRYANHVEIKPRGRDAQRFDYVFIATHSDQALRLLADPTPLERTALGSIPYQHNEAVLHTDDRLLPNSHLARAAWNYHVTKNSSQGATLTYHMNTLQSINAPVDFCVTLNNSDTILPEKIIKVMSYSHPLFTRAGVVMQRKHPELNGPLRTYFCGAYWRFGFHEDGVVSALDAVDHFERDINREIVYLSGAG